MKDTIALSVLMPVYNAERFLREAIDSILGQTYFNFEFLILNDGSTDSSSAIIDSYTDPRIKVVHAPKNQGLVRTLNKGIDQCSGRYIVRMDADDISAPDRLEKQYRFMEENPDIGVCGTSFWILNPDGTHRLHEHPVSHKDIVFSFFSKGCVIGHPTVILRKSVLLESQLRYDTRFELAEDYALWSRLARVTKFANLAEPLLSYRLHENQITKVYSKEQIGLTEKIRHSFLYSSMLTNPVETLAYILKQKTKRLFG